MKPMCEQKRSKKVRKGDKVLVIAGNCRGQTGTVIRCASGRVIVQGINIRKKHVKPTQQNPKGNILEIEKPIDLSNVRVCDDAGHPLKLKAKAEKNGEKVLYYVKDKKEVVYRTLKK